MKNLLNQTIIAYDLTYTSVDSVPTIANPITYKARVTQKQTIKTLDKGETVNCDAVVTTKQKLELGKIIEYNSNKYQVVDFSEWRDSKRTFGYYTYLKIFKKL